MMGPYTSWSPYRPGTIGAEMQEEMRQQRESAERAMVAMQAYARDQLARQQESASLSPFITGIGSALMKSGANYLPSGGTMLQQLKNVDQLLGTHSPLLEELMAVFAYGKALRAEYEGFKIATPKWLLEAVDRLAREIPLRYRAAMAAELAKVDREIEELRSREEKKQEAVDRAAQLRRELAGEA